MQRMVMMVLALLLTSGFTVSNQELKGERKAQETLPHAADPLWATLRKTKLKLNEKEWTYTAAIAPEVKLLDGKPMTIRGFMLPLDTAEKQKHFILSRLTPVCPFCPPGEPNEIIDVNSDQGVVFSYDMITITGNFKLVNNGDKGIFYQLNGAHAGK